MRRHGSRAAPYTASSLEEAALAYVARFATTRAKLLQYLARKLRERGWEGEGEPPVDALADRMVAARYIDEAAYARARTGSLLRRGYGERRIDEALRHAGVDNAVSAAIERDEAEVRHAALALARKRRLGPYAAHRPDQAVRQKQIAAMQRAGHSLVNTLAVLDARSVAEAEDWAAEPLEKT